MLFDPASASSTRFHLANEPIVSTLQWMLSLFTIEIALVITKKVHNWYKNYRFSDISLMDEVSTK